MRIGVAGAGALGYHHVRILREMAGAAFAGFFEPDAARAAQVSAELGVSALPSLEALLAASDAVSVAAATTAHHAIAMAALAQGRHLFLEKPITATVAEADAVLAAAEARGVVVAVGHGERVNRAVRAAMPVIRDVRYVEVTRFAPFTARGADVSVVRDLTVHDLDLVLAMVGAPVTRVDAVGACVLADTLDVANARLTFANGAAATVSTARVAAARERRIRVVQRDGLVELDLLAATAVHHRLRADADRAAIRASKAAVDVAAFTERVVLEAPEGEPLRLQFAAWLRALRGEGRPVTTGREGRDALALALAVEDAILRGAHARA
ncbi:MAG: Gfo/Idh/MocA family oxidoreductase [Gemmatimonadetes bacterium]|nr:Gfo/Idh/MocA family oxidoreductase [Gemmatimonadota bacterium]